MKVEICETWYRYKIIIPKTDREVKCLARLRESEKMVISYDRRPPGIRERRHVVYEISDWLRDIIEKVIEISKLNMIRKLPDDLHLLSKEEIERIVNEVLDEGLEDNAIGGKSMIETLRERIVCDRCGFTKELKGRVRDFFSREYTDLLLSGIHGYVPFETPSLYDP